MATTDHTNELKNFVEVLKGKIQRSRRTRGSFVLDECYLQRDNILESESLLAVRIK
ncbi:hypothetical protein Pmar_PMAR024752 [Perkinsus marinus ATCC 50983]|uniref:Uncharacterized protein n=1 Tax=Perkinsus marinus (strain ATCC 50983 / TXsc) TaxID=423536 RepID=C5M178_PERM5|nr:hypothetical protein Pmar_PMAR024752 [Perkinsus marinus ATCC 50983]EEQ97308.1 hypothetical protein Pmar_PMAR024752 [Perkinsus marinus ATCC 50983]|eukprot:XP_002764591.1 hypothetical protein Pmar_PMAR024752 [Perkinsus marinus ATCC 50983]